MRSKMVQLIFLRNDLANFPTGALLAQVSHASVAAIHTFRELYETQMYLNDIENMTTIVYEIIENDMKNLLEDLENLNIKFYVWNENHIVKTCVATQPVILNDKIMDFKKRFKLFK